MTTLTPSPTVRRPVMFQQWRHLTFLHWRYPADVVQALLPAGLTVETTDGAAWVGLIPFRMVGVRAPGVPALPWLSRFPETNVRTYVRGPDGRTGIWFLSLDAARLPAVVTARAAYGLPYFWSDMAVGVSATTLTYRCRRRWPGPRGARCDADVVLGDPLAPAEVGPLDDFLTARFRLYSRFAGRLVTAEAEHAPWPLHRGQVTRLDQTLVRSAGLPDPSGDPLVHVSSGVSVRVGAWHAAAT
jgi:uncharacterized protein YqjF (DUF2071 family)